MTDRKKTTKKKTKINSDFITMKNKDGVECKVKNNGSIEVLESQGWTKV